MIVATLSMTVLILTIGGKVDMETGLEYIKMLKPLVKEQLVGKEGDIEFYVSAYENRLNRCCLRNASPQDIVVAVARFREVQDPVVWKIVYGPEKKVYECVIPNVALAGSGSWYTAHYDTGCNPARLIKNYLERKDKATDLERLIEVLVGDEVAKRHEYNSRFGGFNTPVPFGETQEYLEEWERRGKDG